MEILQTPNDFTKSIALWVWLQMLCEFMAWNFWPPFHEKSDCLMRNTSLVGQLITWVV